MELLEDELLLSGVEIQQLLGVRNVVHHAGEAWIEPVQEVKDQLGGRDSVVDIM